MQDSCPLWAAIADNWRDIRSHHAVIRVYDAVGNMIEMHEHAGEFKGGAFTFVPENGRQK
jgi:hypothetical protein